MRNVILMIVLLLVALVVSALFTFRFFGTFQISDWNGKDDDARVKAEHLRIYEKTYSVRHDRKHVEDLSDLARYAEDGERAIIDPWGKRLQFRYVIDPKTGKEQFVVWTVSPTSGEVLAAPPEAADWLGK